MALDCEDESWLEKASLLSSESVEVGNGRHRRLLNVSGLNRR